MSIEIDTIDRHILAVLQENCKLPLAKIGERVGLSAPSVNERIRKLEESGIIRGYTAVLDARKLGKDITAFIGVFIDHPKLIGKFEKDVAYIEDVQECHHVTGEYTLLLKIKTENTSTLEALLRKIRSIEGVARTETSVVLRTSTEGLWLDLKDKPEEEAVEPDTGRRGHEEAQTLKLKRGG
jgi:Lrp/AsnC family leucine-responsive transcriptional regulator